MRRLGERMRAEEKRGPAKANLILPNFIGVGPGRTGTTWLDAVLEGHVGLPRRVKELDFFSKNYGEGIEWYAAHFRHCASGRPVGEFSPSYYRFPGAPERIALHIPRCKIIVTLRNPVARAYSHYKMLRHYAFVRNISFERALQTNPQIMDENRYASHLLRWYKEFGKDRVLVCLFDDLCSKPQSFLDRICDFLEAPRRDVGSVRIRKEAVNSYERMPKSVWLARRGRKLRWWLKDRQFYRTMDWLEKAGVWGFCFERGEKFGPLDADAEARLIETVRPEIEALENLIGRDLSAWKRPSAPRSSRAA